MKRTLVKIAFMLLLFAVTNYGQEQVRIMSYNFLKYPNSSASRNPYLSTVIDSVDPDILVCQEIFSLSGVNEILNEVLPLGYSAGTFKDGNGQDTDNAIFYKDSLIEFISHEQFPADPRMISVFRIKHKSSPDTLVIFGVHLKASDGSDNEAKRQDSAVRLRFLSNKLSDNSFFLVMGDFNIYESSEPAFQTLIDQTNRNYFIDPLNESGNWHNSAQFRHIHTQSTRTDNVGDGGVTGGLDDRFDIILVSQTIIDEGGITIDPDSYTAFGNDGKHFNHSINTQPNDAVSVSMANALYYASDHLPVYTDLVFENITSVENNLETVPEEFTLEQNYPNPFNPVTNLTFSLPVGGFTKLTVSNILGREVAVIYSGVLNAGTHTFQFNGKNQSSGIYFYSLWSSNKVITKKMMIIK